MTSETRHGTAVFVCPADGLALRDGADAVEVIGAALGADAELVVLPVQRLTDDFFTLRTGVAGEIAQKFVNYRLRLAVLGDISGHLAASSALRDFVRESNRGRQLWFLTDADELDERLSKTV